MNEDVPEAVKLRLNEIIQLIQERKLAIFYGAGISISPPSNLPSGGMLRKFLAS